MSRAEHSQYIQQWYKTQVKEQGLREYVMKRQEDQYFSCIARFKKINEKIDTVGNFNTVNLFSTMLIKYLARKPPMTKQKCIYSHTGTKIKCNK